VFNHYEDVFGHEISTVEGFSLTNELKATKKNYEHAKSIDGSENHILAPQEEMH
jgi:hypothetical protein